LFQLTNTFWRFLRVNLRHTPVVKKLAATDGVAKVRAPIVCRVNIRHSCSNSSFSHNGVRFPK
jgi:hypothetical protein